MAENSKIEWTKHTFNAWWGCARVSPACRFCYADRDASRWGHQLWRRNGERKPMSEAYWKNPAKWNRDAEKAGVPAKVFCASMSDVFEDHPQVGPWRERLWGVIESTPWLTWQLLTKRIENVAAMVPWSGAWPRNVWIGTSVETQRFADQRLPHLVALDRAAVRFISAEPLLGPLDLSDYMPAVCRECDGEGVVELVEGMGVDYCDHCVGGFNPGIDWVIAGGESGPKARPSAPTWFLDLRDQCMEAQVPFHFKQWGEWGWDGTAGVGNFAGRERLVGPELVDFKFPGHRAVMTRVGKKAAGRLLDGRTWDEYPAVAEAVAA